ncbi:PP2C family protein-serine/threonine phosphatase, partial [Streptomyces sp. NPDC058272]
MSVDRLAEPSGRGLVAIPLALIVVITVVDIRSPTDVHLGPLLVIAPALTASVAGPRVTALVGALAVAAQVFVAALHGGLTTTNHVAQIIALAVLSALVVFVCQVRERRARELSRARSVAETAQLVLLRPPPRRIGPLRVAWLYLAAEDETQIGGDLFAVSRATHASTRVIIGDVRGKGLASIGEASVLLGAFREGAHRYTTLPELAAALEVSVCRDLEDVADTEHDPGEHFITALVLDLSDHDPHGEMINCGHPPPLLLHDHEVTVLHARHPMPPLGMCEVPAAGHRPD